MKWAIVFVLTLSGCATNTVLSGVPGPMTSDPLRPVYIDCNRAVNTVNEMQAILTNPGTANNFWDQIFSTLNGNQSSQQRASSAKTVLWSARTQCYAM